MAEAYTYDPVGNRLTGPHHDTFTYDRADRLTADEHHTYTYDRNGNLVEQRNKRTRAVTAYSYDAEDRLLRVVTPSADVEFQYDPLGRRTEKRAVRLGGERGDRDRDADDEGEAVRSQVTRYLYDQEDILATFDESHRERARYTHGPGIDEPLAEVGRHGIRFYHADVLGSIIALTEHHGRPSRQGYFI